MPIAEFNNTGDLPEGIHTTTIGAVVERFASGTERRQRATQNMLHIYAIAQATGKLDRFLIFGSYITAKLEPNDVDIVLVMADDFDMQLLSDDERAIFNHQRADRQLGASIFWIRPAMLLEPLEQFMESWQNKRDGARRGIVEVIV